MDFKFVGNLKNLRHSDNSEYFEGPGRIRRSVENLENSNDFEKFENNDEKGPTNAEESDKHENSMDSEDSGDC